MTALIAFRRPASPTSNRGTRERYVRARALSSAPLASLWIWLGVLVHSFGCGVDTEPSRVLDAAVEMVKWEPRDSGLAELDGAADRPRSPILLENTRAGTAEWALSRPAIARKVEGYPSEVSVRAGAAIDIFVSVDAPQQIHWEVYRLGYYQGLGGRLVHQGGALHGETQAACPVDSTTGLIVCSWKPSFTVRTQADWVSGYYLVKLTRLDGYGAYVPFIVTEATPRAPALVQASVTTWQAYNLWGGLSLYHNELPEPRSFKEPKAFQVSFDRPLANPQQEETENPVAKFSGAQPLFQNEFWLVSWLEERGFDVAYTTNLDITRNRAALNERKLFISSGHDEYWPQAERDAIDEARNEGVSLAFLSANTGYWRIDLSADAEGRPDRIISCYKGSAKDPAHGTRAATTRFREGMQPEPENELIGEMYEGVTYIDAFPLLVKEPDRWPFAGSGLRSGDSLGNIVGYEWDHVFHNDVCPKNLTILTQSFGVAWQGASVPQNASVYFPTKKSFVFAAGTIDWSWGLARPGFVRAEVRRITENLLNRAGVFAELPEEAGLLTTPAANPGSAADVSVLAGTPEAGFKDGSANEARFNFPVGLVVGPDGTTYVSDSLNHRIRAISRAGEVRTLAGCQPINNAKTFTGSYVGGAFKDGDGTSACFNVPTGMTLGPDGALYVVDSRNNRIRRVTLDGGTVTTFAGGASGFQDGPVATATFSTPQAVAFGSDGTAYVADSGNNAIRRIKDGIVTTALAGNSALWPTAIARGDDGKMYFLVSGLGRIYSFSENAPADVPLEPTVVANASGRFGDEQGPALDARLRPISGLAVVGKHLVFSDSGNYSVKVLDLVRGQISRLVGTGHYGHATEPASQAEVVLPRGIAAYAGRLLIADSANHRILSVDPGW